MVDLTWSARPGIPIRMSAVESFAEQTLEDPVALDLITVAVPDATYKVKEHRGALMRVSPQELSTAFVLAVARGITRGEAAEVLQKWKGPHARDDMQVCLAEHSNGPLLGGPEGAR